MPNAKLTKHVDYYKAGSRMISYPSGFQGEMPQAHYDYAVEIGAVDGVEPPAQDQDDAASRTASVSTRGK